MHRNSPCGGRTDSTVLFMATSLASAIRVRAFDGVAWPAEAF